MPKKEMIVPLDPVEEAREKAMEREKTEKLQNVTRERHLTLTAAESRVYREALKVLNDTGAKYAVGAAFARYYYTNIWRPTKDLDVFVKPEDLKTVMDALKEAGFETEIRERSWLAKAWKESQFLDLIFGTGHGQLPIDDGSFEGSVLGELLGVPVHLIPIEEMIASAMYIAGRNRFDGPEVVHLIHGVQGKLDWQRILNRLQDNRELLLWHLILFDFVYPGHSDYLPRDLMKQLFKEVSKRWNKRRRSTKDFRGTLLDPYSYMVDVADRGYEDRRVNQPLVDRKGKAI